MMIIVLIPNSKWKFYLYFIAFILIEIHPIKYATISVATIKRRQSL